MESQISNDVRIVREKEIMSAKYWAQIYSIQDLLLEKGGDVVEFLLNSAWMLLDLIEHIKRQPPQNYLLFLISELTEQFKTFHTHLRAYQPEEIRHLGYQLISLARRLPFIYSNEEFASFLRVIKEIITRLEELKAAALGPAATTPPGPAAVPPGAASMPLGAAVAPLEAVSAPPGAAAVAPLRDAVNPETAAVTPLPPLDLPTNMDDILIAVDILEANGGDLNEGLENLVEICLEYHRHIKNMINEKNKDDSSFIIHFKKGVDVLSSFSTSLKTVIDGRINESRCLKCIVVEIMSTMLEIFRNVDVNVFMQMWVADSGSLEIEVLVSKLTKKMFHKFEDIRVLFTQAIKIRKRIKMSYLDEDVTEELGRLRMLKEE